MSRGGGGFALTGNRRGALALALACAAAATPGDAYATRPHRPAAARCAPVVADYAPLLSLSRLDHLTANHSRCSSRTPATATAVPLLAASQLMARRATFRLVAVTLAGRADDVVKTVPPGATVLHCRSQKVVSVGAYDIVAGAELSRGYATVWRLDGRLKAVTRFEWPTGKPFGGYILDRHGATVEDGHWHVELWSGGGPIGATDVDLRVRPRC